MSETQSNYVNTYIDTAVGTIHEYLSVNLQLKTQLKITNALVKERDETIASLRQEIDNIKKSDFEYSKAKDDARRWEDQFNAMKNKISHMDNLMTQVSEMKKMILDRDEQISKLKSINKTTKKQTKKLVSIEQQEKESEEQISNTNVVITNVEQPSAENDF
jgi:myosin heavy subunit